MNAAELFSHWKTVRRGLVQALAMLSDEQLSFSPRQRLRTLGQVTCHIAEAGEGWFRFCTTRELAEWPQYRSDEHATVDSLVTLLGEVHDRTEVYLAALNALDLHWEFRSHWGDTLTPRQVIWHVQEHEIHHRGEIYLMLGLLGLEAPDVYTRQLPSRPPVQAVQSRAHPITDRLSSRVRAVAFEGPEWNSSWPADPGELPGMWIGHCPRMWYNNTAGAGLQGSLVSKAADGANAIGTIGWNERQADVETCMCDTDRCAPVPGRV